MDKCAKCGMPIDEHTKCACTPNTCYHCCTCGPDCKCGCQDKAKK